LETQNKDLKALLAELENAQDKKTEATIAAVESEITIVKVKRQGSCWKVRVIAAATHCWDRTALRRKQVADKDVGQICRK
jgi:hypothetical protein